MQDLIILMIHQQKMFIKKKKKMFVKHDNSTSSMEDKFEKADGDKIKISFKLPA